MTIKGSLLLSVPIVKRFFGTAHDLEAGGLWKPHTWNPRPHFAYSLFNFCMATMTIKGGLLVRVPIVKRFSAENFLSPAKTGPQNGDFSRKWGSKR